MAVVWVNGSVGAGKSAVGRALAGLLPRARFLDGDDLAGPRGLPNAVRWRMAVDALLQAVARPCGRQWLVIAYPLDQRDFRRLKAACGKARRGRVVVNLMTPLTITLRGRGGRRLSRAEQTRVRAMRSAGWQRRPFATASLPNAEGPAGRAARRILSLLRSGP